MTRKTLLGAIILTMITCGCSKPNEEDVNTPDARLELRGTSESNEIPSDKTSIPIAFSTNQSWLASSDVNWIFVTPNKGSSGDAAIVAMVEENTTSSDRTGKVTIKAGNISKDVSIIQRTKSGGATGETITFKAINITSSSLMLSATTNSTKSYYWDIVKKSLWDSFGGETIWNSIIKEIKDAGILSDFIVTGNDSYNFSNMEAGTEYVAYAAFCDNNGIRTGEFFTETFKTNSGEPANGAITLTVTNITSSSFTVTATSNSGKEFFFDIIEKSVWDKNGGNTVWNDIIKAYLNAGGLPLAIGWDQYTYTEEKAGTEYIAFAAFCDNNGIKTGEIFTETFKTSSGSDPDPGTNTSYLPTRVLVFDNDYSTPVEYGGIKIMDNVAMDYSFLYGSDGRILQHGIDYCLTGTRILEGASETYSTLYAYDVRGFSLERTTAGGSTYKHTLNSKYYLDSCESTFDDKLVFKYDDNNHLSLLYDDGAAFEHWRVNYTWDNDCLTKITYARTYQNNTKNLTISFSYGSQSNPYYGLNFDPTLFWLNTLNQRHLYLMRCGELEYLGYLGKNSKKLATSVTIQGDIDFAESGKSIKSYSATYEVSGNELKKMTVVKKFADNSSQTQKYLFYNEKYK